jgi:hypothetical protein
MVQKLIAAVVERDPPDLGDQQHRADLDLGPRRCRAKKKSSNG